ncbi:unnamed protein product [Prunus armeniaca]
MAIEKEEVEEIVKARTDKREYRRIVLPNSLEVLLISDPDTDKANGLSDTHFSWPLVSLNFYFLNSIRLCAASMDVSVGAFSNPDGLEGLAHFLGSVWGCCD